MPDLQDLLDKYQTTAPTNLGLRRIRNYVDLKFGQLNVEVNHTEKYCEFSFPVKNLGDLPAKGPFSIVVGVSYKIHNGSPNTIPQSYTHEQVFTFAYYNEIAGGATYMTPPIRTLLGYINISNANKYDVEINIDSELQLAEASETNNRTIVRWFTASPPSAATNGRPNQDQAVQPVTILSSVTKDDKVISTTEFDKILATAKTAVVA